MPLSSPVAWYNQENTSDSGPNGYTLTNTNSVSFANAGVIGNCGTFASASSQRLEKSDETNLRISGGDLTITYFLNPTSITSYGGHIGKLGSGNSGWGIYFNGTANNSLYFCLGGGFNSVSLSTTISTGAWQHFVIRRSGSSCTVWINGVSVGSWTQGSTTESTATMYLGWVDGNGGYLDGKLDLVGLYNYAISDADIATLYNGGAGYDPTASSTTIKTLDGVTNANIKTILGVTRANVKTWNGVT